MITSDLVATMELGSLMCFVALHIFVSKKEGREEVALPFYVVLQYNNFEV